MFGFDDVEEMGICVAVPDSVVLGAGPCFDPIDAEVLRWIAFHLREHSRVMGVMVHIVVAFYGGDEGEEVFFELKADELF